MYYKFLNVQTDLNDRHLFDLRKSRDRLNVGRERANYYVIALT